MYVISEYVASWSSRETLVNLTLATNRDIHTLSLGILSTQPQLAASSINRIKKKETHQIS